MGSEIKKICIMRDVLGYTQLSLQASQELHRPESFGLSPAKALGRELSSQAGPFTEYNHLGREGHVHPPPERLLTPHPMGKLPRTILPGTRFPFRVHLHSEKKEKLQMGTPKCDEFGG